VNFRFDDYITQFVGNVDASGDCWLWTGGIAGNGYGYICIDGKMVSAHRFSWLLHNGDIPDGMQICHKCDVRKCVNPDHMFLGSAADNAQDKVQKGRQARGINAGVGRYTTEQVLAVVDRRRKGFTLEVIAAETGMSLTHVSDICRGRVRRYETKGAH